MSEVQPPSEVEALQIHLRYANRASSEALNEAMLWDWEEAASPEWELVRVSVLAQVVELHRTVEELKGLLESWQ